MASPLAGIGVVELGGGAAIAYAGKLFADLGANVTRIGPPTAGGAAAAQDSAAHRSALGLYLDVRKATIAVDISQDAGRAELYRQLSRTRVLFHAASDCRYAAWGLTPEALARQFPDLAVVAVTPFGLNTDARYWPAHDVTLQAIGGISIGIGLPGRQPLKLPGDQSAFQAGLVAAIAGAGALFSGRGALIDVSSADVWASFYSGVEVALAHFGRHKRRRAGHRVSGQPYPRTIYRCKDGYFAIQCGESRHWQSFLRMIGREELAMHPLFANRFKANDEHGDACDALIEPWFLARNKEEILQQCLEHRIPGAPVYEIAELPGHPQLCARGYFVDLDTAHGRLRLPGHPYAGLGVPAAEMNEGRASATSHVAQTRSSLPGPSGARAADTARPLAGLRVIDFGWVWAGAVPGHILADLGAEVIKVESAKPLDYMRQGRPIFGTEKDPEQNPMFHNVNRGKLSLRINLDRREARDVLRDLVASSDIVIENFSPGVMAKFGLAYPELKAVRPDLVMCSMSAVGQSGPLRKIRTYATMIGSLAGLDGLVRYPGERVLGSQSSYADPNASLHAVFGILAALWRREKTGEGAYIDLSQWEAAVSVMGEHIAECALRDRSPAPSAASYASTAPCGNYPAAGDDQWIALVIENDAQWQGLRNVLGKPEWMSHAGFSTAKERHASRSALDERLAQETRKHEAPALACALLRASVPAAPLLDASSLAAHAVFQARELFEMVEHPVLQSVPVYRLPWHVNGAPVSITRRAPLLGEHNDYTLTQVLGYSSARIAALTQAGLFE